jgi:ATP-dependent protease ClpP protease subunit
MKNAPVSIILRDDIGIINVECEITEGLATTVEAGLEKLFGYYKYERIILRISSPGGLLSALRHILQYIQKWRVNGHTVETEVTFTGASAAAMLLSFGEFGLRTAHRHTTLLYHHSRVGGTTSSITATGANQLASILTSTDQSMLLGLVHHIVNGSGGIRGLCSQGSARCALLSNQGVAIALALELCSEKKPPPWLKVISGMYREVGENSNQRAYLRYLAKRMETDTRMDLREAYALCLIDNVHCVPDLQLLPETNPSRIQSPEHMPAP